ARMECTALKNGHFDYQQTATAYARAFRNYKTDLQALPPDVAAEHIRESKIRHELVVAALDWALITPEPTRAMLLGIAQAAAADNHDWERPLIDALLQPKPEPLVDLAKSMLESKPSATALMLVAQGLATRGRWEDVIEVLIRAQRLFPGDFLLNTKLGGTLGNAPVPQADKALPFLMIAVALAPDNPVAHSNLGNALRAKGQIDEAITEYRRALELKADYAGAHSNLGLALRDKGQLDEAIAEHRRALEVNPDFAAAHCNLGDALRLKGQLDD